MRSLRLGGALAALAIVAAFGGCAADPEGPVNPAEGPWADAARRGVTFRALGNEPSWYVEIFPDRLAVVTELGTRRVELPYTAPTVTGSATTYRATGVPTRVVIEHRTCNDTMSGEVFEATVTVTLEDRVLHGCGRSL